MDTRTELLAAVDLGRRTSAGVWLLRHVNVTLFSRQKIVLVGPSGSGKSVLLRALSLLDPLETGSLRWRGVPVAAADVPAFRRQCMYLHQRLSLGEGTVEAALQAPFAFEQHAHLLFDRVRIVEWLQFIGRDAEFLDKPVDSLSGGESQMVALLRAMQLAPTVLLLDEPTAALDQQTAATVENLVRTWQEDDAYARSFVWVSHDQGQAERIGDKIWRMENGELKASG